MASTAPAPAAIERRPASCDAPLAASCWVAAASLGFFLAFLQLAVMASLMVGRAGFRVLAPASLAVTAVFTVWLARRERLARRTQMGLAAGVLLSVLASVAVSAFFYDLSWDGEWYQQTAVIHIARDWNPITDPMHGFTRHLELWVRHYSKGPWYIAAATWITSGHIEYGKFIPWLAMLACFFAILAACLDQALSRRASIALAALVSVNPVVTSELPTYLVDGIMYCFVVVAAAAIVSTVKRSRLAVTIAAVTAGIVAINAKFTGLVFLCFALAAIAVWCAVRHRGQLGRLLALSVATVVLGACVWGYNPYVTNTIHRHQPFYPVLGSAQYPSLQQQGKNGIDRYETPKNMVGRSRFVRFAYATFGRPGNQPYRIGKDASLMWPFDAHLADLYCYTYHETRIAGFGPWFSGCLLLCAAVALWIVWADRSTGFPLAITAGGIVASLLISAQLWWPRYGPQMWLLPVVTLLFAFRPAQSSLRKRIAWLALVLLLVNAGIVGWIRMKWEVTHTVALRRQLRDMRNAHTRYLVSTRYFSEPMAVRLGEAGIAYQDFGMKKIPRAHELVSVVEGYPDAVKYIRADEYRPDR